MKRVKAVVQYDGTAFLGFQRQKRGRTVQETLEASLGRLLGHEVKVKGAGRTDAGVHARGQVVSFLTDSPMPAERIPEALAGLLPEDVLVVAAEEVPLDFDPQKDARRKTYCYRIWRKAEPDVFFRRYSYWYPGSLDFDLMQKESASFLGRHDFRSFRASGSSAKTTVREVSEVRWAVRGALGSKDALWEFWVTADGFLYKMVRLMVGTVLDVARGHLPEGTVAAALTRPGQVRIGRCVPGKGLCLEQVAFS